MSNNLVSLRVWGDFACFTRPEMKVERVSYPVMTPSAARGILEAIFWEPEIHYLIDSVRIVKRGDWVSFRRNEIISVISVDSAKTWMKSPQKFSPILAGGGAPDGTQRNMLALENVEYIITAEVRLTGLGRSVPEGVRKYLNEFTRRARLGKCFHRPVLGVREFAADFDWEEDGQAALERRANELGQHWRVWVEDLGLMLYDVFDHGQRAIGFRWSRVQQRESTKKSVQRWEGALVNPEAVFFHAQIENSRMDCHPERISFARQRRLEVD